MEILSSCNIKRNKKLLVSDIIKFFETRGYTLTQANAYGMTLQRGTLWGNLISQNPLKWRTLVKLDVIKIEKMDYDLFAQYKFSTWGQFLSPKSKLFFTKEAEAFTEAMIDFKVDVDEIERLGTEVKTENTRNLLLSFIMGLLIAILLMLALKIYLPFDLPLLVNSGLTLFSIVLCNFILNRSTQQTTNN